MAKSAEAVRPGLAGAGAAEAATGDGVFHVASPVVDVVDTTAAGDCFVGVLASALDRGATLGAALGRANAAAALCCTRHGSQSSIPRANEADAFLAQDL